MLKNVSSVTSEWIMFLYMRASGAVFKLKFSSMCGCVCLFNFYTYSIERCKYLCATLLNLQLGVYSSILSLDL